MNKELLTENLNEILEGLKTVIHTANAELPSIFEEIVRLGMVKYSFFSIIFFVGILLCVGLTIFCIKNDKEFDFAFYSGLASLILLMTFAHSLSKLLFVYISPKLYIIHYLKDLIQ